MFPPAPTIFAHRGASLHAPENTLAAFRLALQHGADGIELDAKLSVDGQVVVIHDQTVDRTTDGRGRVAELPLATLKSLDAGSGFDAAYCGESIPTLNEVFEVVGRQTFTNIELTNYATPGDDLPDKVADLVKKHNLAGRVMFSSFNPRALRRVAQLLPDVARGLLAFPGWQGWPMRSWPGRRLVDYQALHPERRDTHGRLVEEMHRRGRRVHVWTVNEAAEMQRLFSLGVDGIFTDDPRLAKQVLKVTD